MPLTEPVIPPIECNPTDTLRLPSAEVALERGTIRHGEQKLAQASASVPTMARRPTVRRPSGPAERVGEVLPQVMRELGLTAEARAVRILEAWDRALGPRLAAHCRPDGVRRDVLWARVPDSAWMQRIQLEKARILARLEEELGEPAASDLRLRIGAPDR